MYGNGGLSCWTKQFVEKMQTHEHSDGSDDTCVEFCFDPKYQAMHDCYSTTYPNGSPYQAWRAGFREGVKMCLDRGAKPTLQEFEKRVHQRNYDHLCIWQTVGRDVENGWWAIYGARLGTYLTMLKEWDYRRVQDFNHLKDLEVVTNVEVLSVEMSHPHYLIAGSFRDERAAQRELKRLQVVEPNLKIKASESRGRPVFYIKSQLFTDRLDMNKIRNRLRGAGAHVQVIKQRD